MKLAALAAIPLLMQASPYSTGFHTEDGVRVVRLHDTANRTEVAIAVSIGNLAYAMKVNGKNVFWTPFATLAEFKAKPALAGNPFLAPWANRIEPDTYHVNSKAYLLNGALGNLRRDPSGLAIHGLLLFTPHWEVTAAGADDNAAFVTSRLDYWKYPELMAQFPFAHTVEMTYRLSRGVLEIETVLKNHGVESMPVAIGYHPYFRLHDTPRDAWKVRLAAERHVTLSPKLVPTGETTPVTLPDPVVLGGTQLDDVFTGLKRGPDGRAVFSVEGAREKLSVAYGPKYPVAIVYAPRGRDFICFEPMAAPTNAFNLAHAGKYADLQTVQPDGEWRESFWVIPSGF